MVALRRPVTWKVAPERRMNDVEICLAVFASMLFVGRGRARFLDVGLYPLLLM